MKLLSWNVNGLRAVHRKGLFLPWIEKEDADVVCLQETKAHPEQLPEELLNLDGYHSYFAAPNYRKGYSGTALYTKKKPKNVTPGFGINVYDREGRTITRAHLPGPIQLPEGLVLLAVLQQRNSEVVAREAPQLA